MIYLSLGSMAAAVLTGFFVQRSVIREQHIAAVREHLASLLASAENARAMMSRLQQDGAFAARLSTQSRNFLFSAK